MALPPSTLEAEPCALDHPETKAPLPPPQPKPPALVEPQSQQPELADQDPSVWTHDRFVQKMRQFDDSESTAVINELHSESTPQDTPANIQAGNPKRDLTKTVFEQLDINGDGKLDKSEFSEGLAALQIGNKQTTMKAPPLRPPPPPPPPPPPRPKVTAAAPEHDTPEPQHQPCCTSMEPCKVQENQVTTQHGETTLVEDMGVEHNQAAFVSTRGDHVEAETVVMKDHEIEPPVPKVDNGAVADSGTALSEPKMPSE